MSRLNRLRSMGLPIEKDQNGDYVTRGKRSIRIYGERLKPILAAKPFIARKWEY